MISAVLTAVIGNYMISMFVLGIIVAAVQLARWRGVRSGSLASGLFLNNFVFYALGISQVINFIMHSVFGDYAAKTIGWAQSPFQLELALSSLGFGVAGILLHGRRSTFRAKTALVIASAIFGLGAAAGHIYQSAVDHDYAVNNTGLLLIGDIAINLIGIAFVVWHFASRREATPRLTDAESVPAPSRHTVAAEDAKASATRM